MVNYNNVPRMHKFLGQFQLRHCTLLVSKKSNSGAVIQSLLLLLLSFFISTVGVALNRPERTLLRASSPSCLTLDFALKPLVGLRRGKEHREEEEATRMCTEKGRMKAEIIQRRPDIQVLAALTGVMRVVDEQTGLKCQA